MIRVRPTRLTLGPYSWIGSQHAVRLVTYRRTMTAQDLNSRILAEIKNSGFPLELATFRDLHQAQWVVSPNLHFRVGTEVQEIDAFALSPVREDNLEPRGRATGTVLIVECKKSREKPWVFFEQNDDPILGSSLLSKMQVLSELELPSGQRLLRDLRQSRLVDHHFHDSSIPVARTYFEAFNPHFSRSRQESRRTVLLS